MRFDAETDWLGFLPYLALLHPRTAFMALPCSISYFAVKTAVAHRRDRRMELRLERDESVIFGEEPKMAAYLQTDPLWAAVSLGASPYFIGQPGVGEGCAVCAVTNLIHAAGWGVDPGILTRWLNANGGFTAKGFIDKAKDGGAGLLYWRQPSVLFSAYTYSQHRDGSLNAEIWQAKWDGNTHFNVHLPDGTVMDSLGGSQPWDGAPAGAWEKYADACCDYAPASQPSLVPAPEPSDQYAALNTFKDVVTVKAGASNLNVRTGPGTEFAIESRWPTGTVLYVTGAIRGSDQSVWYRSVKGNYFSSDYTSKPLK